MSWFNFALDVGNGLLETSIFCEKVTAFLSRYFIFQEVVTLVKS